MLECSSVYPCGYANYSNYKSKYNTMPQVAYYMPSPSKFCFKDNQKVGFWEGLKTLAKGIIKPIMNIIQHPFKSALGIGAVTALIIGTGGAATPFLIAIGLGIGGYQTGKGIYNFVKSDTRYETLAALEDIGEGSFTLAASAFGAKAFKGSASATAAAADKTGTLAKTGAYIEGLAKDSWDVLKLAPSSAKQTASIIFSKNFITNLKPSAVAIKIEKIDDKIKSTPTEKLNTPEFQNLVAQRKECEKFLKEYGGNNNICKTIADLKNKMIPWKNAPETNLALGLNNYIPDDQEAIGTAQYLYPELLSSITSFA